MAKNNPFHKYLRAEDRLQMSIADWMKYQYPNVPFVHTPNEGRRTAFEQFLFKRFGGLAGVSDFLIFRSNDDYNGFALEIKVVYAGGSKNYPSKPQKKFLETLAKEGWCCGVAWSFEEATEAIKAYMEGKAVKLKYML
jgi:hypothetical protein